MSEGGRPPAYAGRYPRSGRIAILCEGDVAGYEVDALERWTHARTDFGFVDVWACGTKSSIYGMTDALGRSIPILAIEDRDYRTPEEASKDCRRAAKDREKRVIRAIRWRSWARHEIENYFLDLTVLVPVFKDVFAVDTSVVESHLAAVLHHNGVDQALQRALYRFRTEYQRSEGGVAGLPRSQGRPSWTSSGWWMPSRDDVAPLPERHSAGLKMRSVQPNSSRPMSNAGLRNSMRHAMPGRRWSRPLPRGARTGAARKSSSA